MTEFKYKDIGVAADTLYRWLGTFWTHVVTNASRTAARNMQKGATLAAAQKQLDMLESLQFKDRKNVPVFHRDRWTPAVIYKNERNTGDATMVKLATGGGDEQYQLMTDNPLKLGAATPKAGYVYYPLDLSDLCKQPDCLCDNIFNPSKILIRDRDFVLRDNSIIFREADDPFTKLTYNINTDPGSGREECVLWLFNAEVDRNYVYDSIGHVVNIYTESSEVCKRIINMVWDCYTNEANVGIISSLLGALYDVPTCLTETETVEIVNTTTGLVVTDKNVYYADPDKLSVRAGDVVNFGDAFDTRLRLYGYPFADSGITGVTMDQALPAITLPASMFKTSLKLGPATLNRVPTEIVDANDLARAQEYARYHYGDPDLREAYAAEFTWSDNGTEATITGYLGSSSIVVIPAYYYDLPVVGIDSGAFATNLVITELYTPKTLTHIGTGAFSQCVNLIKARLPGVTTVDIGAFFLTGLNELYMPEATTLGQSAIQGGTGLTSLSLPKVQSLEYDSLGSCTSLTSLYLGDKPVFGAPAVLPAGTLTIYAPAASSSWDGTATVEGHAVVRTASFPVSPEDSNTLATVLITPRFKLFQADDEDDRFWANLWAECEAVGPTTAISCFSEYITYNEGSVLPGTIKPLEWYLGFMAGPNTLVARVDASKPDGVPALSISKLLPAHAMLIVLETTEVTDAIETRDSDVAPDPVDVPAITSSGDELAISDKIVALKWRS